MEQAVESAVLHGHPGRGETVGVVVAGRTRRIEFGGGDDRRGQPGERLGAGGDQAGDRRCRPVRTAPSTTASPRRSCSSPPRTSGTTRCRSRRRSPDRTTPDRAPPVRPCRRWRSPSTGRTRRDCRDRRRRTLHRARTRRPGARPRRTRDGRGATRGRLPVRRRRDRVPHWSCIGERDRTCSASPSERTLLTDRSTKESV